MRVRRDSYPILTHAEEELRADYQQVLQWGGALVYGLHDLYSWLVR